MARKLTAGVVVRHPGSGVVVFLPEGSELPEWAESRVGDHVLTAEAATTRSNDTSEPELTPAQTNTFAATQAVNSVPPPKAGPGSSRARWVEYAAAYGIAVTDDETRDEIIAACEAAGVPTD